MLALFGIGFFAGRRVGGIGRLALFGIGFFAGCRLGGIGRHVEVLLTISLYLLLMNPALLVKSCREKIKSNQITKAKRPANRIDGCLFSRDFIA